MSAYILGIHVGPRFTYAAIAAGERLEVVRAEGTDARAVLDAAIRHEGGRPAEIRLVGAAELPGAVPVTAARAVAHQVGAGADDVVAVCDRGEATILRGSEILAARSGADTLAALAGALETAGVTPADLSAIALIGAARHAEERVRHRFGRAEPMDDDAVAIGAATMPTPRAAWTAAPPPPAAGAGSWAAPPPTPPSASPPAPPPPPPAAASPPAAAPPPAVAPPPAAVESPPAATLPAAASSPPAAPPRRRAVRRRRLVAALALVVLVAGGAAAALSLRGDDDDGGPRADCRAAMADGSDEGVQQACRLEDYVPDSAERCDWYIAAGDGTSCMLAVAVFADWFARERPREVRVGTLRFECSGEFLLECAGPGSRRAYVMRALDLLR